MKTYFGREHQIKLKQFNELEFLRLVLWHFKLKSRYEISPGTKSLSEHQGPRSSNRNKLILNIKTSTWAWAVSMRRLASGRNLCSSASTISFAALVFISPQFFTPVGSNYKLVISYPAISTWLSSSQWPEFQNFRNQVSQFRIEIGQFRLWIHQYFLSPLLLCSSFWLFVR